MVRIVFVGASCLATANHNSTQHNKSSWSLNKLRHKSFRCSSTGAVSLTIRTCRCAAIASSTLVTHAEALGMRSLMQGKPRVHHARQSCTRGNIRQQHVLCTCVVAIGRMAPHPPADGPHASPDAEASFVRGTSYKVRFSRRPPHESARFRQDRSCKWRTWLLRGLAADIQVAGSTFECHPKCNALMCFHSH
eukprot:350899-Chlamydomonas_euryale.AAC.3